ncbi:hypothetical protein [Corynebacterium diphtheriae]|uniref:hypothetical protein n=1 Tax=Corynebacterium diphtheriae TaxID=1717 RepID=UPI0013DEF51E|nr:hypothetical protein [Corynebacterium diphtheriae]UEB76886.1 hypothetical protein LK463_06010 [Corynebacterium diphtheriae]UWE70923.1 hypothetical protein NY055_08520 [Corynebacterium diphtheriae bv. mitis]
MGSWIDVGCLLLRPVEHVLRRRIQHGKDGICSSQSGLPLAKDSWLFAIAGALLTMKK